MKRTVYTWMLTLLTVFGATVASADEKVSFEVKAPMVVAKGEAVRVEFSLNASPDEGSFTAPSFEGFDVIAGPAFSQGSSIQIVNGQMTRSSNYTITYVLLPQQEGNFTIGAASVRVGKSQYKTKALLSGVSSTTSIGSALVLYWLLPTRTEAAPMVKLPSCCGKST